MAIEFLLENTRKEVEKLDKIIRDINLSTKQDDKTKFLKRFVMELVRAKHHDQFITKHKLDKIQPTMLKPAIRHIPYFKPHELAKLQRVPERKKFYKVTPKEYPLVRADDFTIVRVLVNGIYKIIEPPLTDLDIRILNDIHANKITTDIDIELKLKKIFDALNSNLSIDYVHKIKYYLSRDDKLGKIGLMMKDDKVRRISCTGIGQPVHVTHIAKDMPTDITYNNLDEINGVIKQLARIASQDVNEFDPIIDAVILDGIRVQAILGTNIVSPKFIITK